MRKLLLALPLLALAIPGAFAQTAPAPAATRMPTQMMLGERVVREVMLTPNGGGVILIYDMMPGATQSRRALRLENVNGMLEVVYDGAATDMPLATGGTPRLVQDGAMYRVEYDRR